VQKWWLVYRFGQRLQMRLSVAVHRFGMPKPIGPVHAEQVSQRSQVFAVQQLFGLCVRMFDRLEGPFVQRRRGRMRANRAVSERRNVSEYRRFVQMRVRPRFPGSRLRDQHRRMRFL